MARMQVPRYVWLLDILLRRGRISLSEIQQEWERSSLGDDASEYSRRTFMRDKQSVEELFDLNIACEKRAPYRYYIENKEALEKQSLRSWLMSTLSTANVVQEGRSLAHRILVEPIPSGERYLADIILAMKRSLTMELVYSSYWKVGEQALRLEPYAVKNSRQRWYLLARPSGCTYPKIYALDRIVRLSLGSESFQLPADFDASDYFYSSFGIIVDEEYPVEEVRLKAYGVRVCYLDSLPLHHTQRKVAEGEGWAEYSVRLRASIDFQQELMSYAPELEVLSPEWLRRDICAHLTTALRFYQQDTP